MCRCHARPTSIDFEGEFGVVTDAVPMGVSPSQAVAHIALVVIVNDWSLRAIAREEMRTGFGWIQAKPACSLGPYAITPDALGANWDRHRAQLRLRVEVNGTLFGEPHGGEMSVGFDELVAHAAATRTLCAGTIVGSGTVSNDDYHTSGSTCIAERRAIEMLDNGAATTPYLRFGARVRISAHRSGRAIAARRDRSAHCHQPPRRRGCGGRNRLMVHGNKVIITVAVNGGMQQSRDGAFVPTQPVEIGEAAARCHEAGASIVHVHARDAEGRNTGDRGDLRRDHSSDPRTLADPDSNHQRHRRAT